jgi:general secretion pathway protein B
MSYILDALKKSEQERQQHQAPTVHSIYAASRPFAKSASLSWIWVTVVVVLAAIACTTLLWWYSTHQLPGFLLEHKSENPQQQKSAMALRQSTAEKNIAGKNSAKSAEPVQAGPVNKDSQKVVAENSSTVVEAVDVEAAESVQTNSAQPLVTKAALEPVPTNTETEILPVMRVEELPDTVRNSVPEMTYSFHVYSTDKNKCTIIINNKRYREGEMIAGGWMLDSITETGIIVRKERYRAAIQVVDNW